MARSGQPASAVHGVGAGPSRGDRPRRRGANGSPPAPGRRRASRQARLALCILWLVPLVAAAGWSVSAGTAAGLIAGAVLGVLAIPLLLAALAHYDLLRMRGRYGLTEAELDEVARLVPRLAIEPEYASLAPSERRRSVREAGARIVLARRGGPGGAS